MKKILTELCLIMGMISVINPMIAEAQSADNYPFDQPGQPLKLNLPKGLTEKIEQGNFIPGKTPPDQIKTWLDSANSEDTHLIALQYLDLSHSDSQTIIANVLQTGSEKEIGFLGQKLLKQNKSNAQNVIMTAYPLAANKVQKQALLSLLGSTKAPEAWPLLLTYYLKLGKEINFLSPQNDANDILYLNQLAKMMRNYPSNELIKDLSPLLGKDFTTQILALKLLYPLNYAPTIDILRRTLEQSDSEQVKSILREIFLIPSSTIIYSMGRRIPNFDIEPVSDREIFTLLLKNYTQGIIDEINPQGEP